MQLKSCQATVDVPARPGIYGSHVITTHVCSVQACCSWVSQFRRGAFGTAMANHLASKGITVQLWAREEEVP